MMYLIKQLYEDFYVEELPDYKLADGPYTYFWLEKRGLNTSEALDIVARQLNLNPKKFGYAGNKDRQAITQQVCSVYGVDKNRLSSLKFNQIKLTFIGLGQKPISLGDLQGNKFEIVIRNLEEKEIKKVKHLKKIINYFDEQRFSTDNVEIGRALLKKDFEKVVRLLLKNNLVQNQMEKFIQTNPKNFIGAIRLVPKKLLMLFIHAYQSHLWNLAVEEFLKTKKTIKTIPLIGFGTEIKNKVVKEIIDCLLKKEALNFRDFILREIPEISAEGQERSIFVKIKDFKILEKSKDELNKDKNKVKVSFALPKGSYGTLVVKNLFRQ